ncbi:MAG: diguanylate cyclase, partial [Chthonomonadaceae bacterium]|nr:diguanylate cyclase [Chthonomonadaceae bacterium]
AKRLQDAIAQYDVGLNHHKLGKLHLGASVGVAVFPEDGEDCAALMATADAHMYKEKSERKLISLAGQQDWAA